MSDGLHDSCFEDDYDTERIKDLTKTVKDFEIFDYHLTAEDIIEMIESYSSLRLNYMGIQEEILRERQEGYLSNINHAIKKIKEIMPQDIQDKLKLKVGEVEKIIYKEFSDKFPDMF